MAVPPNNNNNETDTVEEDPQEMDFERVEVIPEMDEEDTISVKIVEKREDTRGRIAQFFILGFFICLLGVGIAALITDPTEGSSKIDSLRESVLAISGILSGPLGFIIGYYFRKSEE